VTSKAIRWSVRKRRPIEAGERDRDDDLGQDRRGSEDGGGRLPGRPARPRCLVGLVAEVGDHEEEHHHHRAAVDEHLGRGDELPAEEQVEDGEGGEIADQSERREEGVREADDRERARQTAERGTDPHAPDEEVRHR